MHRMLRMAFLPFPVSLIVEITATSFVLSAERSAKLSPVRIAVVSRGTLDLPFWVAREQGLFRDEGIDAEIIIFRASLTVQAMIGGSVDFGTARGTAPMSGSLWR